MHAPHRLAPTLGLLLLGISGATAPAALAAPTVARSASGTSLVITALPLTTTAEGSCPDGARLTVRGKKAPTDDHDEHTPSKTVTVHPATAADGACTLTVTVALPRSMREGALVVTIRGKGIHAKRRQLPAS